ncbi:MAG: family 20 glycosylhydrolase [Firmicutes bacterium]|nr:family 20 glycosylhydrolase [Bacillota bacterium]
MNSNYLQRQPLAGNLIPKPVRVEKGKGPFSLTPKTEIVIPAESPAIGEIGAQLAAILAPLGGTPLKVSVCSGPPPEGSICLNTGSYPQLGAEGYRLEVGPNLVSLSANEPGGLFYGVQTIKQLFSSGPKGGPGLIEGVIIEDFPRFSWRGAMLDVARNFFSVQDVKGFIRYLAAYKFNRLHLHLSNDQGWRIMINSWPNLALHGGSGAVSGGRSGYYSQEEYSEIVAYAQSKQIIVVPEIDLPGHTTAALASYPELNRKGIAPPLYSGTEVGFSSLAPEKDLTYRFVSDVLEELAALTPGPYLHVGGDEALSTTPEEYEIFMSQLQPIVARLGKTMIGWGEIAHTPLQAGTIVQIWRREEIDAKKAAAQGVQVIMSPAYRAYMDMKYNESTKLGLSWAGLIKVEDAYNWDPAEVHALVPQNKILGVEAVLWTETIRTMADLENMVFPRLAGYAEIGWSPRKNRSWEEYRYRLAAHGRSWEKENINFYRCPEVPWGEQV